MVKLLKYQRTTVKKMSKFDGRALLALDMGLGKAQPLDEPIPTPEGWTTMGDLKVDDEIMGSNGGSTRVTGVYPQGKLKVYRVEFADGSYTHASGDHLWTVNTLRRTEKGLPTRDMTTREIMKSDKEWHVPLIQPAYHKLNDSAFDIFPYIMGYILASGERSGKKSIRIRVDMRREELQLWFRVHLAGRAVTAKTAELQSIDLLSRANSNGLIPILEKHGIVVGKKIIHHIPNCYKFNTGQVRMGLLNGILDCMGTPLSKGGARVTLPSKRMLKDTRELVQSLGGIAWQKPAKGKYILIIKFDTNTTLPWRVFNRIDYAAMFKRTANLHKYRVITNIEYVGKKECQCIKVSAKDQLYATKDYIITHNTLTSLRWAVDNEAFPLVVVCPASVKWQWQDEAYDKFGLSSIVCEGRSPDGKRSIDPRQFEILIINYDILNGWVKWIRRNFKPKTIIADECHYLKNRKAKRTKAFRRLVRKKKHVIALSGTPLVNRPVELFPVLNILRPDKFGSFVSFTETYCRRRRTKWGWEYKGAKNLDKLHRRLKKSCMIRYRKEDVLTELPTKTRQVVPLDMTKKLEYLKAERNLTAWLRKRSFMKAQKASKAEEVSKMMILRQMAAELKMVHVFNWIDDFLEESNEKLVLFAWHKKVINLVANRYNSAVITGEVPAHKRKAEISKFQHNSKCRIFIGNIKAAGTGVNGLQKVSSEVAFLELPWSPADLVQAEDRLHRFGQRKRVRISYLVARGTIEHMLMDMLQKKKGILDQTLDGINKTDLAIYDQLVHELKRKK